MRGLLPVYGSRFEVRGSRFEVRGSGFAVRGLRFGVCGFERFNKLNAGLIRGIGFEVRGSRFEVSARPGGEPMRAKKMVQRNTFHNRNTKEKVQGSDVDFPPRTLLRVPIQAPLLRVPRVPNKGSLLRVPY